MNMLLIGREIGWADVVRHVFRVIAFDRTGTVIRPGGKVKAGSWFRPYGYLYVDSPILNRPACLPIIHRDDFFVAARVADEPELARRAASSDWVWLVAYVPQHALPGGLTGVTHALHYAICPTGTLGQSYDVDNGFHRRAPAPAKLFGRFFWDGIARVEVRSPSNVTR